MMETEEDQYDSLTDENKLSDYMRKIHQTDNVPAR